MKKRILILLFLLLGFAVQGFAQTATPSLPYGMEFISIPGGSFQMGSLEEGWSNTACHRVQVSSFELMSTEVTQGMWETVMGTNPSHDYGEGSNYPVYYVSWDDCQDFIDKLNDFDPNHTYRLPTEAEWEYACRAGTSSSYYWGNSSSESSMSDYCWYQGNSNSSTHSVGTKTPNSWGLYDMSGNVMEWCLDSYTNDYSLCPTDGSAYSGIDSERVHRGGSCTSPPTVCSSSYRLHLAQFMRCATIGVRLARS